jgi:hypothetical protein
MSDDSNTKPSPSDGWLSLEEAIAYTIGAASDAWTEYNDERRIDGRKLGDLAADLQKYILNKYDSVVDPNRSKGEKIVADCLLHGEPFFVFRARDILTPAVIRKYIQVLEDIGPDDPDMQASVIDFLNLIRKWQAENITKVRYPD